MRQSTMAATPHKMGWAAIAVSLVVHTAGFAAIATWSTRFLRSHVRFAGSEQAIQLTLSFTDPEWSVDLNTFDNFQFDPPVVIESTEAHVGKHTFVYAPTVEISPSDPLLNLALESTPQPPEQAARDNFYEGLERPGEKTPTEQPQPAKIKKPEPTVVQSSSSLGNTEVVPPDLSQNTPPAYPSPAIKNGWQGTVLLRVWIDETGQVTKVEVAHTSGFRILDGAAASAVRRWNAIPSVHGGKPVATVELLPVQFKL